MDPLIKSQLLYQLSYAPIKGAAGRKGSGARAVLTNWPWAVYPDQSRDTVADPTMHELASSA